MVDSFLNSYITTVLTVIIQYEYGDYAEVRTPSVRF